MRSNAVKLGAAFAGIRLMNHLQPSLDIKCNGKGYSLFTGKLFSANHRSERCDGLLTEQSPEPIPHL
ncbi:MAG: hypothetical protein U1D30_16355 [Planctomycetota bacterium]